MKNTDDNLVVATSQFVLFGEAEIITANDYNQATQLDRARSSKDFSGFNRNITDENFMNASVRFEANKKYTARIFVVNRPWISVTHRHDWFHFVGRNNFFHGNAQGLSIAWQQAKDIFPKDEYGAWVRSYDEQECLWQEAEIYQNDEGEDCQDIVPYIHIAWNGSASFNLGIFDYYPWGAANNSDRYFICFSHCEC